MSGSVLSLTFRHPGNPSARVPWLAPNTTAPFSPAMETPRQVWGLWECHKVRGSPSLGNWKKPISLSWWFYWKASSTTLGHLCEQERDLGCHYRWTDSTERLGHWKILKVTWELDSDDSQCWKGFDFLRRSKPTFYSDSQIWLLHWLRATSSGGLCRACVAPTRFWADWARDHCSTLMLSSESALSLKRAVNKHQWPLFPSWWLLYATGFPPDREQEGKHWRGRSSRGHSDLAARLATPRLPLAGSRILIPFCLCWQRAPPVLASTHPALQAGWLFVGIPASQGPFVSSHHSLCLAVHTQSNAQHALAWHKS